MFSSNSIVWKKVTSIFSSFLTILWRYGHFVKRRIHFFVHTELKWNDLETFWLNWLITNELRNKCHIELIDHTFPRFFTNINTFTLLLVGCIWLIAEQLTRQLTHYMIIDYEQVQKLCIAAWEFLKNLKIFWKHWLSKQWQNVCMLLFSIPWGFSEQHSGDLWHST